MGDEIAQRGRRMEAAFAAGAAPVGDEKPEATAGAPSTLGDTQVLTGPSDDVPILPDRQDSRDAQESTNGFGLVDSRFRTRLSKRERVIIAAATALTFAATVAIAVALTGK